MVFVGEAFCVKFDEFAVLQGLFCSLVLLPAPKSNADVCGNGFEGVEEVAVYSHLSAPCLSLANS